MKEYLITTSTPADMEKGYFLEREIPYICFHYEIDGKEYLDDLGDSMSNEEFYKRIKKGADTKTSQVNVSEYLDFFGKYLEKGYDILHVELSSGISGSYNSALLAKKELDKKYPNNKLLIVDSLCASSGLGLFVDSLKTMKDSGSSIEEVYEWAENNKLTVHHWFFSTNLEHFKKGGRISNIAFVFSNLLSIYPLLNVSNEGKLVARKKIHGKKNLFKEMVNKMVENATIDYSKKCYICQSDSLEDASLLAKMIEEKFPKLNGKVLITNIGTTIGSHTGCGTVAVFFYGKERTN